MDTAVDNWKQLNIIIFRNNSMSVNIMPENLSHCFFLY